MIPTKPAPELVDRRRFLGKCGAGLALISLSTSLPLHAARGKKPLLVGASRRRVTPPLSVPCLTSSGNGTNAPFQGRHDDLFARALVLDDGRRQIASSLTRPRCPRREVGAVRA